MSKLLKTLGLAMRASKVISGEEFVLKEIRSGKAKIVILTTDAAKNVDKKITDKCRTYKVPLIRYGTRRELGNAIGKAERVVVAITDSDFTLLIQRLVQ